MPSNWLGRGRLRVLSVFWAVRQRSLTLSEQTVESIGFQITTEMFSSLDITRESGRCGRGLAAQYGLVTRIRLAFWIPSVLLPPTSLPLFFPRRSFQGGYHIFFFFRLLFISPGAATRMRSPSLVKSLIDNRSLSIQGVANFRSSGHGYLCRL